MLRNTVRVISIAAIALAAQHAQAQSLPVPLPIGSPSLCAALKQGYENDGFALWQSALRKCQIGPPAGLTDPPNVVACAMQYLPPSDQLACVQAQLLESPIALGMVNDVAVFNAPPNCDALRTKYRTSPLWTTLLHSCRITLAPPLTQDALTACAWALIPPPDQIECLRRDLATADVTKNFAVDSRDNGPPIANVAANQTHHLAIPLEKCRATDNGQGVPDQYFTPSAPRSLFEIQGTSKYSLTSWNLPYPAQNLGSDEGRLRFDLRETARAKDPLGCALPRAANAFAQAAAEADFAKATEWLVTAKAYADLAVTGRGAYGAFSAKPLDNKSYCSVDTMARLSSARGCPLGKLAPPAELAIGCELALARAYDVANFLRTGQTLTTGGLWFDSKGNLVGDAKTDHARKITERNRLGWITVSGEDDAPHRPVNVPSTDWPQYETDVIVGAPASQVETVVALGALVSVRARYVIAQAQAVERTTPRSGMALADQNPDATWRPSVPPGSDILIFIHGMDSRAEEADDLTRELFARLAPADGRPASRRNLVVITVDLPSSGYTQSIDFDRISLLSAIGGPGPGHGIAGFNPIFHATGRTPLIDFLEDFEVAFVEKLHRDGIINKFDVKAVIGGSLGGNLSFRLGRRQDATWIPAVIPWSPASVWTSLALSPDSLVLHGLGDPFRDAANTDINDPFDVSSVRLQNRRNFFNRIWDTPIAQAWVTSTQPEAWFSDSYDCKKLAIAATRLDRQETYDPLFRKWHWRLGLEQLIYSHHLIDSVTNRPLYRLNDKRMLLACGMDDHVRYNEICSDVTTVPNQMLMGATYKTAIMMTTTAGSAEYLYDTGHALANERPKFWAGRVATFLGLP